MNFIQMRKSIISFRIDEKFIGKAYPHENRKEWNLKNEEGQQKRNFNIQKPINLQIQHVDLINSASNYLKITSIKEYNRLITMHNFVKLIQNPEKIPAETIYKRKIDAINPQLLLISKQKEKEKMKFGKFNNQKYKDIDDEADKKNLQIKNSNNTNEEELINFVNITNHPNTSTDFKQENIAHLNKYLNKFFENDRYNKPENLENSKRVPSQIPNLAGTNNENMQLKPNSSLLQLFIQKMSIGICEKKKEKKMRITQNIESNIKVKEVLKKIREKEREKDKDKGEKEKEIAKQKEKEKTYEKNKVKDKDMDLDKKGSNIVSHENIESSRNDDTKDQKETLSKIRMKSEHSSLSPSLSYILQSRKLRDMTTNKKKQKKSFLFPENPTSKKLKLEKEDQEKEILTQEESKTPNYKKSRSFKFQPEIFSLPIVPKNITKQL